MVLQWNLVSLISSVSSSFMSCFSYYFFPLLNSLFDDCVLFFLKTFSNPTLCFVSISIRVSSYSRPLTYRGPKILSFVE